MFCQVVTIPLLMATVVLAVILSALGVDVASFALGGGTHKAVAIYGFSIVCTFLSIWLVLAAVFAYLNIGQAKKIEVITGFYTADTIADYFEQFWSGRDGIGVLVKQYRDAEGEPRVELGKDLAVKLKGLFEADFGLQVYIVPVIILVAVGSIVLFFGYTGGIGLAVAQSVQGDKGAPPVMPFGIRLDIVSIAAIFGAFTWVASDVIVRNYQWTLHPSDLGWYSLRMIIAVPLGQALALTVGATNGGPSVLPTGAGAFLAFVISLFSLDAITTALGTAATRFGVQMQSSQLERDDLLTKLAGVDDARARALSVEGVTTIAQMVTVDPIRLSIRTGLQFEYILNLIDASLLWVFVGANLKWMSRLGLRGASDVLALNAAWNSDYAAAQRELDDAAATADNARNAAGAADAALAAARAQNPVPPLAQLQQAADERAAAVTAARQRLDQAVFAFVGITPKPSAPVIDRAAMMAALIPKNPDGTPGLTPIGFDMISERLREDGYALFVRRLLES